MVSAAARSISNGGGERDIVGAILCNCSTPGCGINNDDLKNVCSTFGGCQKTVSLEDDQMMVRYACIPEEQYKPFGRPLHCYVHRDNQHANNVGCCREYSFCSQDLKVQLFPRYPPVSSDHSPDLRVNDSYLTAWHVALYLILCVGISVVAGIMYMVIRKRRWNRSNVMKSGCEIRSFLPSGCAGVAAGSAPLLSSYTTGDVNNMLLDIERLFDDSGTGGGAALLVSRTIARSVEKKELIGKGRFGEVWRGYWKTDEVAIKEFSSRDEKSWLREVDIYETNLTHHENILRYIAADNKDTGISMKLYLITEYCRFGSLFDYLNKTTVDVFGLCTMVRSVANGLAFLHAEIMGTRNKPAIAHRDIKSKNILVKNDGSCCIGDLGLAVRYDAASGTIDIPLNGRLGTKRYLAPEMLDNSVNLNQFDCYRRADIYSFGLVIWEICRRTRFNGCECSYQLPYHDMVPADPSLEDMRKCVCEEKKRPLIISAWIENQVLRDMSRVTSECWTAKPDARLTALRVKKSAVALLSSISSSSSTIV